MIRWLFVVLPPGWTIALFILVYAILEGMVSWAEWRLGQRLPDNLHAGPVLLQEGCLVYGLYRVLYFHPFFHSRYFQWLKASPWTSAKPLPLGPIHLVWQDGVLLAAVEALALLRGAPNPFTLPVLLLTCYLVALGLIFWLTGLWAFGYALAFGLGLLVWLWPFPAACAGVAAVLYLIAYLGLRRSLAGFPWKFPWGDEVGRRSPTQEPLGPGLGASQLGWPYGRLRPNWPAWMTIATRDAILISLLVAWWLYALGSRVRDPVERLSTLLLLQTAVIAPVLIGHLALYCGGYLPPLSLWGRLRTFRWIIPGYDKVLVAPLVSMLLTLLGPVFIFGHGLDPLLAVPLSDGLAVFACLSIGPTLLEWRLTGQHRIVPAINPARGYLRVG